jgi:hypothetical protein
MKLSKKVEELEKLSQEAQRVEYLSGEFHFHYPNGSEFVCAGPLPELVFHELKKELI